MNLTTIVNQEYIFSFADQNAGWSVEELENLDDILAEDYLVGFDNEGKPNSQPASSNFSNFKEDPVLSLLIAHNAPSADGIQREGSEMDPGRPNDVYYISETAPAAENTLLADDVQREGNEVATTSINELYYISGQVVTAPFPIQASLAQGKCMNL